ncbi:hypothetical protein YC2023_044936 [Brassica napus]
MAVPGQYCRPPSHPSSLPGVPVPRSSLKLPACFFELCSCIYVFGFTFYRSEEIGLWFSESTSGELAVVSCSLRSSVSLDDSCLLTFTSQCRHWSFVNLDSALLFCSSRSQERLVTGSSSPSSSSSCISSVLVRSSTLTLGVSIFSLCIYRIPSLNVPGKFLVNSLELSYLNP